MQCAICGGQRVQETKATFPMGDGLAVVLHDAPVRICPDCGDRAEGGHGDPLDQAVAALLVRKAGPLTGAELRYLRNWIGLSSQELARAIGVAPESVSRWEHGRLKLHPAADRLVRLFVEPDIDRTILSRIEGEPEPLRVHLRLDAEGAWHVLDPSEQPEPPAAEPRP